MSIWVNCWLDGGKSQLACHQLERPKLVVTRTNRWFEHRVHNGSPSSEWREVRPTVPPRCTTSERTDPAFWHSFHLIVPNRSYGFWLNLSLVGCGLQIATTYAKTKNKLGLPERRLLTFHEPLPLASHGWLSTGVASSSMAPAPLPRATTKPTRPEVAATGSTKGADEILLKDWTGIPVEYQM